MPACLAKPCLLLLPVCSQAEVSAVNTERERIRGNATQAEQHITALENELESSKQVCADSGMRRDITKLTS